MASDALAKDLRSVAMLLCFVAVLLCMKTLFIKKQQNTI
jgi:hypothetical protein